ncbi:hypothetical protein [Roseivivax sp. CAU 1761]
MTNRLALLLAAVLLALITADLALSDGETLLFLARRGFALLHHVAFWR